MALFFCSAAAWQTGLRVVGEKGRGEQREEEMSNKAIPTNK
jgi:hypothetical protein